MSKDWSTIDVLRHARHDWLNQLQLIKANLSLNRVERVNEIIEEVIVSSRHESNLLNLKVPQLAEYLITFNWLKHPIVLKTEVTGQVRDLSGAESALLEACKSLFSILNPAVNLAAENKLILTINNDLDSTMFMFRLTGSIHNVEDVDSALHDFAETHKTLHVIESYIQTDEVLFSLLLKK
ncbi:Spo0B C-terminal domain-containing protein [Fictibacillus fluitans]|uniref:Spo0B C-terminal domain-containing protein n=1 Tax=Fictibacillus fluitans TaxID=3058422 RepID=A0ABT8HZN9_9BACL|nr:Spo0B C-terminal domain-containing protein [Fictibacillus sp. NE201]MDN4526244.1 Spo0B C-terminal domain-containing protein [Fictibacillus sp. NE201]